MHPCALICPSLKQPTCNVQILLSKATSMLRRVHLRLSFVSFSMVHAFTINTNHPNISQHISAGYSTTEYLPHGQLWPQQYRLNLRPSRELPNTGYSLREESSTPALVFGPPASAAGTRLIITSPICRRAPSKWRT